MMRMYVTWSISLSCTNFSSSSVPDMKSTLRKVSPRSPGQKKNHTRRRRVAEEIISLVSRQRMKQTHESGQVAERLRGGDLAAVCRGFSYDVPRGVPRARLRQRVVAGVIVVDDVCCFSWCREEAHFHDSGKAREHDGVAKHGVDLPQLEREARLDLRIYTLVDIMRC